MVGLKILQCDDYAISQLKQSLLLFDSIGIPFLSYFLDRTKDHFLKGEFEFLSDKKLVWEFDPSEVMDSFEEKVSSTFFEQRSKFHEKIRDRKLDNNLYAEISMRVIALFYTCRLEKPFEAVYLPSFMPFTTIGTKSDIVKIVIEKIPIPDEKSSWGDILDFRNNPANRGKLAGLKVWMNELLHSNLSISEVKDKLEYLLYQYEQSLKIHNIKFRHGLLKTFFIGTAEVLENVAKFKFSELVKSVFNVSKNQVNLLELELNAPGKELAYIYDANEKFH